MENLAVTWQWKTTLKLVLNQGKADLLGKYRPTYDRNTVKHGPKSNTKYTLQVEYTKYGV